MVQNLENEIWLPIIGYKGYEVSNFCRVKSLKKEWQAGYKGNQYRSKEDTLLVQRESLGYLYVQLRANNKPVFYRMHRLMAIHFIPNPENKSEVNHLNGVRSDNRIENLEWTTTSENILHAYRTGLRGVQKKGEANKLATKVRCATLDITFGSIKQASDGLGISQSGIIAVCVGRQNSTHGFYFNYI